MANLLVRPTQPDLKKFQRAVLQFYARQKRDLPWRRTKNPYHILMSEVMLQQTQVDRVIPKYKQFLSRFPTVRSLAEARFADVLRVWLGLGYNGRALRLWRCARFVVRDHAGKLPRDPDTLRTLPGIGPYTAAAVASFAFAKHVPVVDTNVRRVLTRALLGRERAKPNVISRLALDALPVGKNASASQWAQALMDVGALFCRAKPKCEQCPAARTCVYARDGRLRVNRGNAARPPQKHSASRPPERFVGSTRFYRGRIMRALSVASSVSIANLGRQVKEGFGVSDSAWFDDILVRLARDGLIRLDRAKGRVRLP